MFEASCRPRSWNQTLTSSTSESASAKRDDCRSNFLLASPPSIESVPCRSRTRSGFESALETQMPSVV